MLPAFAVGHMHDMWPMMPMRHALSYQLLLPRDFSHNAVICSLLALCWLNKSLPHNCLVWQAKGHVKVQILAVLQVPYFDFSKDRLLKFVAERIAWRTFLQNGCLWIEQVPQKMSGSQKIWTFSGKIARDLAPALRSPPQVIIHIWALPRQPGISQECTMLTTISQMRASSGSCLAGVVCK